MEVATQCPPYSVPDSQDGIARLGVALHLLSGKSHTYQFSLAENCCEGILGYTGEGLVWAVTGESQGDPASHPFVPPARQHPRDTQPRQPLTWCIIAWAQAQAPADAQVGHGVGQIGGTVAPTQAGVDCLLWVQGGGQRWGKVQVGEVR